MFDAIFISDLHLSGADVILRQKFLTFLNLYAAQTKKLYILGDFFNVWAGDDSMSEFERDIAAILHSCNNTQIYFLAGNRDFLLGKEFAKLSGITIIKDPSVVILGEERVLLTHGDQYCTADISHQILRKLTRNRLFIHLFLALPLWLRLKIVGQVRSISYNKTANITINTNKLISDLKRYKCTTIIHGHTHNPSFSQYLDFKHYILSDWDAIPSALYYNISKGCELLRFNED
jgi:UDP-2,3-diacylglucosamine hydrolase